MSGNKGMDALIPLVNRLQDSFSQLGKASPLDLPQIAVVGGQSAGKSSVLENFVGKDFLPRGSGIVTRRPLVLQLNNSKGREYGEFLHTGSRKFTNFDDIRKEIEAETDRQTGSNKGISSIPINLRIYSPHVLNLTLIDLPGMTKIAVGDQPHDIEFQIRDMLMEFITKENCLILAVSPANADLANSDALKLAKEVDPQGLRTIGVVTKLDLMDQGTDARQILENKLYPLRRGYVGVVNRSQKDIDGNKDIKAAQDAERQFFASHPAYSHMAARMGTPKLQQVLNQQLTNHIRDTLPELKRQLNDQISGLEREVKKFDTGVGRGKPGAALMQMLHQFSDAYWGNINGTETNINAEELSGGAKINRIFHERFPYEISRHEYDERQLRREIGIIILNAKGIHSGLFTPDAAFNSVSRRQIERFRLPAIVCADVTMQELCGMAQSTGEILSGYPRLRDETESVVITAIKDAHTKAVDQINKLIDVELAYMNTNHPDFIGFQNASNAAESGQKVNNKRQVQAIGDQIIRKGFLSSPMGFANAGKDFWFVLSASSLTWYKNDDEQELKFNLKTDGLRVRDVEAGMLNRHKHSFELYRPDTKYLFKDMKSLILKTNGSDETDSWKASFLRAGVFPDKEDGDCDAQNDINSMDPVMERRIETIRNLVDSYISIVGTTVRDLVPKTIMNFLINSLKQELDLLYAEVTQVAPIEELMAESEDEKQRRDDILNMYQMAKEALVIINEVSTNTKYEAPPPPIADDRDPFRAPPSGRIASAAGGPGSRPGMPGRPAPGGTGRPGMHGRPAPGGTGRPGSPMSRASIGGGRPMPPSKPGGHTPSNSIAGAGAGSVNSSSSSSNNNNGRPKPPSRPSVPSRPR